MMHETSKKSLPQSVPLSCLSIVERNPVFVVLGGSPAYSLPCLIYFPFLSSNIPSAPAYGVYVSQLIRYARTCSNYQDFMERGKVLTQKLLSQGFQKTKLVATLKKFYGRHHDLVNPNNVAVSRIVSDVFASDAP